MPQNSVSSLFLRSSTLETVFCPFPSCTGGVYRGGVEDFLNVFQTTDLGLRRRGRFLLEGQQQLSAWCVLRPCDPLSIPLRKHSLKNTLCYFIQRETTIHDYRRMGSPAGKCRKCSYRKKDVLSCRKCIFWRIAGNQKKLQEGFRAQESKALADFHKITPGVSCCIETPSNSIQTVRGFTCPGRK